MVGKPLTAGVPPRADVVGTLISLTSYDEVLEVLQHRPADRALVLAFCNVHSVMSARRDDALRRALTAADVTTPDGVPLVWYLRLGGATAQTRVYGPDLMEAALARGGGWRHYFYGGSPEALVRLEAAVADRFPDAIIAGTQSPPFRPLGAEEEQAALAAIRAAQPDLVWVGLGMPKQELWMHRIADDLPGTALLGVGAAFDFLSGTVAQAPDWLQERGLEWAYRLVREPRRLWRRYLVNNPLFLVHLAAAFLRSRRRAPRPR